MRFYLKLFVLAVLLMALASAGYCAAVSVTDSKITIPTYAYEKGFFTPLPNDRLPGYPYTNLRQQDVDKTPTPREYRAVVLENDYVKITLLPDLGCRLYKMIYKPTNQSVFYENEPIKPNPFCEQGWWMATGGVEWCFPLTEHSTNVLRPWNYVIKKSADGSVTVAFSDDHQRTGLSGAFELTLAPDSCAFNVNFRLTNPGYSDKPFMYWSNAMFSAHDGVEFVVPTKWMSYEWETFSWPIKDGKDLSKFDNWPTYNSKFAAALYAGFDGIYDHTRNLGLVRTFPLGVARGAKIFSYGHTDATYLQPPRYTDTGKGYFELMGGYTPSFWTSENLAPRQVIEWKEDWYPISATGGFNAACADVAVKSEVKQVSKSGKSVKMVIFPSRNISGASVTLYAGSNIVKKWKMDLQCGKAVTLETSFSDFGYANAQVYADGKNIMKFNLEEPAGVKEKQPKPLPQTNWPKPETASDYIKADQPAEAIKVFEKTYSGGPKEATAYAIALIRTGRANDALFWLQKSQRADSVPGYLTARIMLQKGDYKSAKTALQAAVNANKKDMRALDALAVVESRLGNPERAKALFTQVLSELPADLLATSEMAALGDANCAAKLPQFLANGAQNPVYLALDYYNLGDFKIARKYAENAAVQEPNNVAAGVVQLLCSDHLSDNDGVESAKKAVANIDVENGLVYGSDDVVMVLEEANRISPNSSRLTLYLATAYQIRDNRIPARGMAEAAAKAEPTLARAYFIQAQCQTAGTTNNYEYTTAKKKVAELLDKCLALNPTHPGYYYNAGWLYGDWLRHYASTAAMKKAVELDPYCYSAYAPVGYDALSKKNFTEAIGWFKKEANSPQHLDGEQNLPNAYGAWMRYLLKQKNYDKLAEVCKEADGIPKTGIRNDFLLTKANALFALKRDEDARKILLDIKAKKDELLKTGWARDWYYVACALDMLGEKDEAKTIWTKCKADIEPDVTKYPDWDYGTYMLAIIQNKLGQPKEAYDNIIKLKQQFKTNDTYREAYEEIQAVVEKK